ncbi:hypothetical protein HPB49_018183 [Dermacentor silvarum]|uniref:Uncharacterized protein n=1 Tax=Dermacentor silvarum TaxID=543639 RepID=A0ACB8DK43_DERSI|nr:hypothetical protein HPB49_018183 [Dermacentor silvarum]
MRPDYNCSPAEVDDVAGDARVSDDRSQRSPQHIADGRAGEEMTESADVDAGNEGLRADTVNGEDDFMKLFSSERLPNCDLNVADAMVTLMAYSISAGLNWSYMLELVDVVNLLRGSEELPSSQYWLRKASKNWQQQLVKRYYFCTTCSTPAANLEGHSFVCLKCNAPYSAHNFYAVLNLKKLIGALLSSKVVATALLASLEKKNLCENSRKNTVLTDITDGALYRRHMEGSGWSDITLTFNTDGARVAHLVCDQCQ